MDPIGTIKRRSPATPPPTSGTEDDSLPLHLKYRPKTFSEVRGQDAIVRALETQLQSPSCPHVFLFIGPSGVGKTTLARILASTLSITDVVEIDAASNSGVDATRALANSAQFRSLFADKRLVILDECHTLSKQAWQPLLKTLEEPPPHLYFALCTTEAYKVPETIKTRCQEYILNSAPPSVLEGLLEAIAETQPLSSVVKGALLGFAQGSIRRLLTGAEKVYRLHDDTSAKAVLHRLSVEDDNPAISLARMIAANRLSWERAKEKLQLLQDENPESARIVIVDYLTKAALGAETKEKAQALRYALDAFRYPCYDANGVADLFAMVMTLLQE